MSRPTRIDFYCAVGEARFLARLIECLNQTAHEARIVYEMNDRTYRRMRSGWHRRLAQGRIYLWFPLRAFVTILAMPPRAGQVRIAVTTPFYLPMLVGLASRLQGVPYVCLVYDLYPEVLQAAGKVREGGWAWRFLRWITGWALRNADAVIGIGDSMLAHLERTHGPLRRAVMIPVGADGLALAGSTGERAETLPVRFTYVGAMGHMHDTETLRGFLAQGVPAGCEFHFFASGVGYDRLRAGLARSGQDAALVRLAGPLDDDDWVAVMASSHVALVTLNANAAEAAFPSKTFSALLAGQAILAICPAQSDLAGLVQRHDCGWVCIPGDEAGLGEVVRSIVADPSGLEHKRRNALAAGRRYYDMPVIAGAFASLVESLDRNSR